MGEHENTGQFHRLRERAIADFLCKVDRVNELATRHQNYGSLFYNQDGFTGALSRMPTPSNLPRMSTDDEALMWDILDLTSSSNFSDSLNHSDLVPRLDDTAKGTRVSGEDSRVDRQHGEKHGSEIPIFPAQETSILGGTSQAVDEESSQWPFGNRVGNMPLAAVPDIPDWMIFGDFTEHL